MLAPTSLSVIRLSLTCIIPSIECTRVCSWLMAGDDTWEAPKLRSVVLTFDSLAHYNFKYTSIAVLVGRWNHRRSAGRWLHMQVPTMSTAVGFEEVILSMIRLVCNIGLYLNSILDASLSFWLFLWSNMFEWTQCLSSRPGWINDSACFEFSIVDSFSCLIQLLMKSLMAWWTMIVYGTLVIKMITNLINHRNFILKIVGARRFSWYFHNVDQFDRWIGDSLEVGCANNRLNRTENSFKSNETYK